MLWNHFLLFTGWLLFGTIHSVLAVSKIKLTLQNKLHLSLSRYRMFYNVVALVTLIPLILIAVYMNSYPVFAENHWFTWVGGLLIFFGVLLMLICIAGYFKQMSGLNNSAPVLKTDGMSRFVRHPLYTGTFIFISGLFFLRPLYSTLVSVLPVMIYTIRALQWEEQKLINQFGSAYSDYKKITPAIFPSLRHMKTREEL